MIKSLKNLIGIRTARKMLADNPALKAAFIASHDAFNSTGLKDTLTKETIDGLSAQLMGYWDEIFSAENPVLECRRKFANWAYEYARYQVITLGPDPEEDPTGLRGQPGVTGEIKEHRVELAKVNENLKTELYGAVSEVTENSVWDWCLIRYWKAYWYMTSFNAIRKEFGDHNATGKDWFFPLKASLCAWVEDSYRRELGLPSALGDDSTGITGVMYATFSQFVENGAKYPDLAWREHYAVEIEEGRLKAPDFNA